MPRKLYSLRIIFVIVQLTKFIRIVPVIIIDLISYLPVISLREEVSINNN